MTDKELGTAAGEIFAKAFTLGYETGREYVPTGGMALTAEHVEKVRTAREALRGYRNFEGSISRGHVRGLIAAVDALFPATEPTEVNGNIVAECNSSTDDADASRAQDITRAWMRHLGYSEGEVDSLEHAKHEDYGCEREDGGWSCYGESGDSLHKDWDEYDAAAQLVMFVLDPAPAVPAEEETKAECLYCDLLCGPHETHKDWKPLPAHFLAPPVSSPVVPAPTETGPWQNVDAIQVGVPFEDKEGSQLVKLADGKFGYLSYPRETPETLAKYAPFVAAAEEG